MVQEKTCAQLDTLIRMKLYFLLILSPIEIVTTAHLSVVLLFVYVPQGEQSIDSIKSNSLHYLPPAVANQRFASSMSLKILTRCPWFFDTSSKKA